MAQYPEIDRVSPVVDGQLYVGGEWREGSDGIRSPTVDPTTETEITTVAKATQGDADHAVATARTCFDRFDWPHMGSEDRARLMLRIADLIDRDAEKFALCETLDMGKPIQFSRAIDATLLASLFRYFASLATTPQGEVMRVNPPPECAHRQVMAVREPLGVVAASTPFNFPLLLAASKIAPAMAAGNTIIHKPATSTPLSAIQLARTFEEAGVPPGVYNLLTGPGSEIGDTLVTHASVDKVAFTGSTDVGRRIIARSAETVKRVTMELGGKSTHLIFADADMDISIQNALFGIFYNKGEICTAGSRLLVERSVLEDVLSALIEGAERMTIGDPLNEETLIGPLADANQLAKVEDYVRIGLEEGAELRFGGARLSPDGLDGKGFFFAPTIFLGRNDMRIAQEEIFGPILTVIPFDNEAEAVFLANATPFGLAAGVQTRDITKAMRVAGALKAGTCWINSYNVFDVSVPFGGYKQSGFGRENGRAVMENYTQLKSIWLPPVTGGPVR